MHILRILSSPRGGASESHQLSDSVIRHLQQCAHPEPVTLENLDATTLAHVDDDYAHAVSGPNHGPQHSPAAGTLAASSRLIQSLDRADCVVIATPMHNYTVPAGLKSWIDHVVRAHSTFQITPQGKIGALRDRPVYVAMASGGPVSGPYARQPDFLTPYLKAVLATVGLKDVTFFTVEGTAGNGAMLAKARQQAAQAVAEHFGLAL